MDDCLKSNILIISDDNNRLKNTKYVNICISGGGSLGCCAVGALANLHKRNILGGMRNFAGSSIGAVIAAALACGASFNFLYDEMSSLNIESLLDYGNKLRAIYNLYYQYGCCPGNMIMRWFESFLEKLTGDKNITFGDVYERFGSRLVITGTKVGKNPTKHDKSRYETVYFDYNKSPNMPVKLALRISTSIPILFTPVHFDGYYWIDGGVLDNYPIDVFDNRKETLGLMFMTNESDLPKIASIYTFLHAIVACYMSHTNVNVQDEIDTIRLNCESYSALDFNLTEKDRMILVEYGSKSVDRFFDKNEN